MKLFILTLSFLFTFNGKSAVTFLGDNAPNGHPSLRLFSDNPDNPNDDNICFLSFLKQYNRYDNYQILKSTEVLSLQEIDRYKGLGKDAYFEFKAIECNTDSRCKYSKVVSSINLEIFMREIISAIRKNFHDYFSNDYSFYLVLFYNQSLPLTNDDTIINNDWGDFSFKIFFNLDLIKRWLLIINKYESIKLEQELEFFNSSIKSSKCFDISSPYCLIRNNDKKGILKYIKQQQSKQIKSIKLDLLFDFAMFIKNKDLTLLFAKLKLNSIYYPDSSAKLYAGTYHNDVNLVEFLLNNDYFIGNEKNNINSEYYSGVTLLNVASASNSYDVLKLLIKYGANKKGRSILNLPIAYSDKTKKYQIFEIYSNGFKGQDTPDIFRDLIVNLVDVRGENILQWFHKLYNKDPKLFKSVFIDSEDYAHRAIRRSGFRETSEMFDFLTTHGLDFCLAFDKRSMRNFGYIMKNNKSHWLNARYKQYLKKCTKTPEN